MPGEDPFGSAVLDFHRGLRDHTCFIERDDGLRTREPLVPYFETEDDWTDQEQDALSGAGPRILDVGCGPGRHILGLQKRAMPVGLDTSKSVLYVCRERGAERLVLGSAQRLPFKANSFNTLLLMSNGLGISGSTEAATEMLADARRVLSRDGTLIAHTTDPTDSESGIEDTYRLQNIARNRPPGLLTIRVVYRELVGPWFELMLMTPHEVLAMFGLTGFRLARSIEWNGSCLYLASPVWKGPE